MDEHYEKGGKRFRDIPGMQGSSLEETVIGGEALSEMTRIAQEKEQEIEDIAQFFKIRIPVMIPKEKDDFCEEKKDQSFSSVVFRGDPKEDEVFVYRDTIEATNQSREDLDEGYDEF